MSQSYRRYNNWQIVIPPPTTFHVVEGQFDDADEEGDTPLNGNISKQNFDALFHCSTGFRPPPGLENVKPLDNVEQEVNIFNEEEDKDEDDSDVEDDDYAFLGEKPTGPNSQQQNDQATNEELFKKYSNRITVEKYEGVEQLPSGAGNKIISSSKKITANRQKVKDKQDRATVEQVMDPRTRMIVFKLLSSEKIRSIDGCISTGKEANVYHATGPEELSYAIKIFKTSILTFKARDKYVSGEFRFRQGYCKKNPRKMVRVWAEKEFRNLLRIHAAGTVLVPQPRLLKSHVLVMDFIGSNGWPSPLLKDVKFDLIEFEESDKDKLDSSFNPLDNLFNKLYRDALLILYRLYKHCKLVHADFSEFNLILKDDKDLYVIDVSQSVEHDHPRSFEFLRNDIKNIQEFFGKRMLVGDFKEIFEFITDPYVSDVNCNATLDAIISRSKKWECMDVSTEVFRQSYIPRKMEEVVDFEQDYDKVKKGGAEPIYTKVMGMKADLSGPSRGTVAEGLSSTDDSNNINQDPSTVSNDADDSGSESSSSSDSNEEKTTSGSKVGNSSRPKDETAEEKKERKKLVKQEKAEKRQTKIKKHVKKRQEKLSNYNSKKK